MSTVTAGVQNKVIHGDCLDVMPTLPDKSVDLIFTSPPYNLGNNHHTGNKRHKAYDDDMPEAEYQAWQVEVLNQCGRLLKLGGSIWYNHKNRIKQGRQISPYEWLLKTNLIVKQEIVWITRSQNFDKIRFYPWTERLYWLTKNPDVKMQNILNHYDVFDYNAWKPVGTNGDHTRAYPVKMVEDVLKCFPEAATVFDPFGGSGTTAIACINTNRNYILIEKEKEYIDIINKRISEHELQVTLC